MKPLFSILAILVVIGFNVLLLTFLLGSIEKPDRDYLLLFDLALWAWFGIAYPVVNRKPRRE